MAIAGDQHRPGTAAHRQRPQGGGGEAGVAQALRLDHRGRHRPRQLVATGDDHLILYLGLHQPRLADVMHRVVVNLAQDHDARLSQCRRQPGLGHSGVVGGEDRSRPLAARR